MGLSGKAAAVPAVKSVGDLTQEAVSANINSLPQILAAYQKYGPEAASKLLEAAQVANPTLKPLGDLLNQRISESAAGGIPATLTKAYETAFRNSSAARGFADSPVSANAEAIGLAGLGEEYAQNTITGANDYGKITPKSPGLGELGLDLPTISGQEGLGQEQNISAINAALDANARKKSKGSTIGSVIGGGLGAITGGPAGALAGSQAGGAIGGTFFVFMLLFLGGINSWQF